MILNFDRGYGQSTEQMIQSLMESTQMAFDNLERKLGLPGGSLIDNDGNVITDKIEANDVITDKIEANKLIDYGFATADIVKLINHLGAGYKLHENVNGSEGTTEIVIDSIKVVFGYSDITPSKSLTSTYKTVNFGCTFGGNPNVVLSIFGAPQIATLILSVSANTSTGFTAHIYASNTTTRGFKFIAIGKAPADERTKNIT